MVTFTQQEIQAAANAFNAPLQNPMANGSIEYAIMLKGILDKMQSTVMARGVAPAPSRAQAMQFEPAVDVDQESNN